MSVILQWSQSGRGCWFLLCLFSLLYLLVYRPVESRSRGLDAPILARQQKLESLREMERSPGRLRLRRIQEDLLAMEETAAHSPLLDRIGIDPEFEAPMADGFQLAVYDQERVSRIDALTDLARKRGIGIAEAVTEGFPDFDIDNHEPRRLWARLALAFHLIRTGIEADIDSFENLIEVQGPAELPSLPERTSETKDEPLRRCLLELELSTGSAALLRFLHMLPLTSEEIRETFGKEEFPPNKPALFVERILIRKNSPEKPSQVNAWIRIVGFYPSLSG